MLAIIFHKCRGGKALTFRSNGNTVTVKQKWQLVLNGDTVTLSKARDIICDDLWVDSSDLRSADWSASRLTGRLAAIRRVERTSLPTGLPVYVFALFISSRHTGTGSCCLPIYRLAFSSLTRILPVPLSSIGTPVI